MKLSITLVLILLTSFVYGQQINYSDWKNAAETEIRLLPKYGNSIKTKAQKEADQELIDTYLAQQGTHRKASEALVGLGVHLAKRSGDATSSPIANKYNKIICKCYLIS